jgi:cobalt-zinc-cadmium efflux system protein
MVTLHAEVGKDADQQRIVKDIKARLTERFGLDHATIEIECDECADIKPAEAKRAEAASAKAKPAKVVR